MHHRADKIQRLLEHGGLLLLLVLAILLGLAGRAAAVPGAGPDHLVYAGGEIVPIPASIPHEAGDMVDRRILPDLRWIAARYPIYVTDGYSGPLPDGTHVGCDECHTRGSDHYNGLAVDLVPLGAAARCDLAWAPITALALWAEPVQNLPAPPFRWVGYNGDAGHGCGNHLHLSWNHAAVKQYELAEWVEVFGVSGEATSTPGEEPASKSPRGKRPQRPAAPPGPFGGISSVRTGGVGARVHD